MIALALSGCAIIQSIRDSLETSDPGAETYEEILAWFGKTKCRRVQVIMRRVPGGRLPGFQRERYGGPLVALPTRPSTLRRI